MGDLRPHLLAGGDHQRRLVGLRVEDPADRVADSRRGVQVHVRRAAGRLGIPVGDPDHDQFLKPEDVAEVVGQVGEHRQLGRARVAEDRRHPVGSQQLERGFPDGRHRRPGPAHSAESTSGRALAGSARAVHVAVPVGRGLGPGPVDPAHRLPDAARTRTCPTAGIPTGQPRVQSSADQFVSKYATGFDASEPSQLTYWLITADWRAEGDIAL